MRWLRGLLAARNDGDETVREVGIILMIAFLVLVALAVFLNVQGIVSGAPWDGAYP